ncbi:MAG: phospholipid/cholesterol/gamma-HCH transport system substrate-binding protein [Actinomycetota bacterium]|jgi:phospholipid/cholesterol/gamma-HCH transport system substrate-binding protein|nr:phospholipid/cholesterol/gamma-HCH transport system substrate-binding protein [Actinomycetota bacterium]
MKSFRDHNPYLIGIATVLFIGASVGAAFLVGVQHLFESAYPVQGVFSDAGGIRAGDDVRVAGVKAGRVTSVAADRRHGHVIVKFVVNDSVRLGADTHAEVALQTLLGTKMLRLSGAVRAPYLRDMPATKRVIPLSRTQTPFDVFELTKVGTQSIEQTNTKALNQLIVSLADITQDKHQQVGQLADGINRVAAAITARDAQLQDLFVKADKLSATLDEKDQTMVGLIDQSKAILDLVARRRQDISAGLSSGSTVVNQLGGILSAHQTQLDFILSTLHPTVDILDRRQADVDRILAWLGPGALSLSQATSHGPWADIYIRAVGPDLLGLLEANIPPVGP